MKQLLKKLIPAPVLSRYHKWMAYLAAVRYGHPTRDMVVIGVTGTKGKSTTGNILWHILTAAGHTVGLTGTANYRIGSQNILSPYKMTMLGRFQLQKYLRQMRDAGCDVVIVETTSEGITQWRHLGIAYDAAVFTNLSPEHIESHGGFENYKQAKLELFRRVVALPQKQLNGTPVQKFFAVNTDNEHGADFAAVADSAVQVVTVGETGGTLQWGKVVETLQYTQFDLWSASERVTVKLPLLGKWNAANSAVAAAAAVGLGVSLETVKQGLEHADPVPGRMEFIDAGQDFTAIVDYAYEPVSLRTLYTFCRTVAGPEAQLITLISSTGGGRDVRRRGPNGAVAAELCDYVIVTDEDPYDDDPQEIIDQVAAGARDAGAIEGKNMWRVRDRSEAIAKAVSLAGPGDVVLLTAKGSEQKMMIGATESIPWDDRTKLREAIKQKKEAATA